MDNKEMELRIEILEKALQAANAEIANLKKGKSSEGRNLLKAVDMGKYNAVFKFNIVDGKIVTEFGNASTCLYQRMWRALISTFKPHINIKKTTSTFSPLGLNELSDTEYEIFSELFGEVIELIAYAKEQVLKKTEGVK